MAVGGDRARRLPRTHRGRPRRAVREIGGRFTLEEIERAHVTAVLAKSATMEEAAAVLGIDDSTLWRKRKKYDDPGQS